MHFIHLRYVTEPLLVRANNKLTEAQELSSFVGDRHIISAKRTMSFAKDMNPV